MRALFLLFILLPIAELLLLIKVSGYIGALPTIALVLLTAVAGIHILRQQSFSTMARARQRLQGGELPTQEIVEGFFLGIGGVFLLVPGFITDCFGLLLLLPPTRKGLVRYLLRNGRMQSWGSASGFTSGRFGGGWPPGQKPDSSDVYEGEFTKEPLPGKSLRSPDKDQDQS